MDILYKFIRPEIVYALGVMLINFMWQALILAMFLGFFMVLTRKSSPALRYYSAIFSLFLLPVIALCTFISAIHSIEIAIITNSVYSKDPGILLSHQNLYEKFFSIYSSYLPIIVFIWFIGITFLLLRNLGKLIIIQRLKSFYIEPVSDLIKNLIYQIRQQFLIKKSITCFMSNKALTPMLIGHFKPVILIPNSLTKQLSADEMKILLQHELAHIKRNDFLINIFQLIIESIFFFHPVTWWISHLARLEREECCDAFAAQTTDEKIILAKALTSIQEYKLKSNIMAMALLNKKSGLYNRVKNLFGNRPTVPSFQEGIIVMLFLFFSMLVMSFVVNDKTTLSERKHWKTVNGELAGGDYMFAKIDSVGSIKELFVNGSKVNKGKYPYYKLKVDSLYAEEESEGSQQQGNNLHSFTADDNYKATAAYLKNKKVQIKADTEGFKMDVGDGKDGVKMNFSENGGYMTVTKNGKQTVHMKFGPGNFEMSTDTGILSGHRIDKTENDSD